jgi:hypothetical protein
MLGLSRAIAVGTHIDTHELEAIGEYVALDKLER